MASPQMVKVKVEVSREVVRYFEEACAFMAEAHACCKECPHWPRVMAKIKKIDIPEV